MKKISLLAKKRIKSHRRFLDKLEKCKASSAYFYNTYCKIYGYVNKKLTNSQYGELLRSSNPLQYRKR